MALVVHSHRGDDGNKAVLHQGQHERRFHSGHTAHVAKINDFRRTVLAIDHHGLLFCVQQHGVLAGKPHGPCSGPVDLIHDVLVDRSHQHHLHHIHGGVVRHPQSFPKLGMDFQLFKHAADLGTAAVHYHGMNPDTLRAKEALSVSSFMA